MTEGLFVGIFISVIGLTVLINIVYYALYKQTYIHFDRNEYLRFEKEIADYLSSRQISETTSLQDIAACVGYTINLEANIPKGVEGRRSADGKNIEIQRGLQLEDRTFTLAHELAHDINRDVGVASRIKHSILFKKRDLNEQICDYYAAALLLPLRDMKPVVYRYETLSKGKRLQMIREIAEEKNVREEVVYRRIQEVRIILSE